MDAPLINITPMSAMEAQECINAIKGNLESLRLMLLELHRRRGWEALEYASWEDCAKAEFGKSRAYTFRLLAAAQVEENLVSAVESTIVDLDNIPVSHLSELAKLPPEQQPEALLKAEKIARTKGKKRNAAHIAQAVQEIKQPLLDAGADATMQDPDRLPNGDLEPSKNDVQNLSHEDICLLLQDFARKVSALNALHGQPDGKLKQMIQDAKRIIKNAKWELNRRFHPENK